MYLCVCACVRACVCVCVRIGRTGLKVYVTAILSVSEHVRVYDS